MKSENKEIPKIIERKEYYPKGANMPTSINVHECFCKKGTIEHHYVSGFNDEWFVIKCPNCKRKYQPFIDRCGYEWKVYLLK